MHKKIIRLRSALLVFLTHNMALPFLKFVRNPEPFPHTFKGLSTMEKGSLGNDLYHFLANKELDLLPYYARHDLKHILLEYDTTDKGEVCLQCFMLGNRHLSFPVAATVLYGLLTMPEYWAAFAKAYKRGTAATSLQHWKWFDILQQDTNQLRQKIHA